METIFQKTKSANFESGFGASRTYKWKKLQFNSIRCICSNVHACVCASVIQWEQWKQYYYYTHESIKNTQWTKSIINNNESILNMPNYTTTLHVASLNSLNLNCMRVMHGWWWWYIVHSWLVHFVAYDIFILVFVARVKSISFDVSTQEDGAAALISIIWFSIWLEWHYDL